MKRIPAILALLLVVSCLALAGRDTLAATAGTDLLPVYQSEEGEKKAEEQEPDCE